MSDVFRVEIPLHEVATNSKQDVVAQLRWVADQIDMASEEAAFNPFELDSRTVESLDYISYGRVTE